MAAKSWTARSDVVDILRKRWQRGEFLTALAEGRRREHKFVGADSSFTVRFFRNKGGISASAYGASLGSEPVPDVLGGLRAGIDEFLADPANALPPDDPAARDLTAAVAKLPAATG